MAQKAASLCGDFLVLSVAFSVVLSPPALFCVSSGLCLDLILFVSLAARILKPPVSVLHVWMLQHAAAVGDGAAGRYLG